MKYRSIAWSLLLACACSFVEEHPNPDFCTVNGGDAYCVTEHAGRTYCSLGTPACPGYFEPELDGCVALQPEPECYRPHGEDDEAASSEGSSAVGDSSTGDSSSESGDDLGPAHPSCSNGETRCPEPGQLCFEGTPDHSMCTVGCETDEDCPISGDGIARSQCWEVPGTRWCAIDCALETCPLGMECVELEPAPGLTAAWCLWPR